MKNAAYSVEAVKSPLARKIIAGMVVLSVVIIGLITAIQIYGEYTRALAGLETQFQQIESVHLQPLTQSLWATNNKEVEIQLEGMLHLPNIIHLVVAEQGVSRVQVGELESERTIQRQYPLRYTQLGETQDIGILIVTVSLDGVYAALSKEAIRLLLNNAAVIFVMSIIMFVLFHRLLTRHLAKVVTHLQNTDPGTLSSLLQLDRKANGVPDELDVLVAATNEMQSRSLTALTSLRESEERVRLLLDSTSEAIYGVDLDGICTFANPACVRMLGYQSEHDLIGTRIHNMIHHSYPDGRPYPPEQCSVRLAMVSGTDSHRSDEVHWRADGTSFPVEYWSHPMYKDGQIVGSVVTFIDITDKTQKEAELQRMAYSDNLTGLANRALFNDRLQHALADAKRRGTHVALMLMDLDRFKVVNDTMGHDAGDKLLREVGRRLKHGAREVDTVARLGGDEFALIFANLTEAQHAAQIAQNVLDLFEAPVEIEGREVFAAASLGVVLYPHDADETDALLKYADSAMYHAKESGRNTFRFYSHEMTENVQERLRLETSLRHALENGSLQLNYQPQVDIRANCVTGTEALLRWRDDDGRYVSPAEFIPLAEETGLIVPIGRWVLEQACRQLKQWHDAGHTQLTMSVNVASRQFHEASFPSMVEQVIKTSGVPPKSIELEITESLLLENNEHVRQALTKIKSLGVTLAIDDFGTGYSSLSYLKRFPIDRVKIDQSFVRDISVDRDDLAIVRAIIALARAMKLRVVAEGVETSNQLSLLQSEQCWECQGFYFARPMLPQEMENWLAAPEALPVRNELGVACQS